MPSLTAEDTGILVEPEPTVEWYVPQHHVGPIQRLKEAALEFYRRPLTDHDALDALIEAACEWGYVIYGENDPE